MYTIGSFLQEKDLPGLKLMAGGDHLQVEVTNINILDNPDSYDWLSSGDLLLTTGYFFREDEALQRQLIRELSELNCVGLAIKTARRASSSCGFLHPRRALQRCLQPWLKPSLSCERSRARQNSAPSG